MLTQFDVIALVIALIFFTLGFFKGAIRSILGLAKWYGAGVLTLMFYPYVKENVDQLISIASVSNGVSIVFTYIVALIGLSILIGIFTSAMGATVGGGGDRFLGALVGLTIGAIIASTGHFFVRSFAGGTDPVWLQEGKTYQYTSKGADILGDYFKDVMNNAGIDENDLALDVDMDPSGSIGKEVTSFENSTGFEIDMEKLKEAIRMLKNDGIQPDQIKNMINVEDYKKIAGTAGNPKEQQKLIKDVGEASKSGKSSSFFDFGSGEKNRGEGYYDKLKNKSSDSKSSLFDTDADE